MISLMNCNPNHQKTNRTRLSVRDLVALYLGAAKGITQSAAACVADRVCGLCECVWQEGGNLQILESAGFSRSHNILNRFRFRLIFFLFFFPSGISMLSEKICITSHHIKMHTEWTFSKSKIQIQRKT